MRGGEEERPGAVVEVVDEVAACRRRSRRARRWLWRACRPARRRLSVHVKVIDGAAAVAAEDAGGVGVVDHHDGAVFFGEVGEFVDGADVAVHGEDAVGDEELAAGLVLDFAAGALRRGRRPCGGRP